MFYCTYCAYYGSEFTGTRAEVVRHAEQHPVGDPRDMAAPA